VIGTGLLAWWNGINKEQMAESLTGTAVTTGMIYMILLGANIFNAFLTQTQLPQTLAQVIGDSGYSPMLVLMLILLMYLILGCVMDSLSMILLTIPIFFPIIQVLDFGLGPEEAAIWFGIIALIVVEVGLITPPVGLNVFVINKLAKDVPMVESFKGVLPFLASDFIRVAILVAFPSLTLYLVRVLYYVAHCSRLRLSTCWDHQRTGWPWPSNCSGWHIGAVYGSATGDCPTAFTHPHFKYMANLPWWHGSRNIQEAMAILLGYVRPHFHHIPICGKFLS